MTRGQLALVLSVATLSTGFACGPRAVATTAVAALGGDAAHVGELAIPISLVVFVARSRHETPRRAVDDLVEDALLASEATARGLDRDPAVRWASTATLGRLVPERLGDEARARGEPTDDELASVRVAHAVVRRSPNVTAARARATADAIWRAVASSRNDDDFETRAKQVPHLGVPVTVERLPEFDASGHSGDGSEIDPTFATAAFALHAPGQQSEIVETPFGWHVIRLIDRIAPNPESIERLRRDLAGAVQNMRVRAQMIELLRGERQRFSVEISASAPALMTLAGGLP